MRPTTTQCCDYGEVIDRLRELRADHRGVTVRELLPRIDGSDSAIRAALVLARSRGDVVSLGRSPSGAQLFGLTSRAGLRADQRDRDSPP
jgi:hypothetical protein